MIRIILTLWGIIVLCGAIDAAMMALSEGKAHQPISAGWWTDQLLHGPDKKSGAGVESK